MGAIAVPKLIKRKLVTVEIKLLVLMTVDVSLATWAQQGIIHRELAIYRRIAERGISVTLLTFGGEDDQRFAAHAPEIEIIPVYAATKRPKRFFPRVLKSLLLPLIFHNKFRAATILKTNQLYGGWVLVLARILFQKKLIVRCGYEFVSAARDTGATRTRLFLMRSLSRLTFSFATHAILSSRRMACYVEREYGLGRKNISVIGNSVNLARFHPSGERTNSRALFVGRLERVKNLQLIIDSARVADIGVDIVGDGRDRDTLERYAKQQEVDCLFHGIVKNEDLPVLLNRCLVFVMVSVSEWLPKALIEAMACGCTVIGSDAPGIRELLIDKENGLLVQPSVKMLGKALMDVRDDPTRHDQLGKNARAFVEREFSLEGLVEREINLYESL